MGQEWNSGSGACFTSSASYPLPVTIISYSHTSLGSVEPPLCFKRPVSQHCPNVFISLRGGKTYEKFIDWMRLGRMKGEKVEVFFPRFELENYEMNNVVCRLGMTDAFEEGKADFSGIFSKQGFFSVQRHT